MLKIGIRVHDLNGAPFNDATSIVNELKKEGISYIQLVYKKAFKNFKQDENDLIKAAKIFEENNIHVAMIGAYFNMIHPNLETRNEGINYFKWCLKTANIFDCPLVGTETGSANGDLWTYNVLNHTEDSYLLVRDTVSMLKKFGTSNNTYPIIEGAYAHVIYKPELLYRLIEETAICNVTLDIFNYLNIENYQDSIKIFTEAIELFGDKIKIFHLKDFNYYLGKFVQCAIGDGILDYKYIIQTIKQKCPNAILILEEVTGNDIKKSLNFIRSLE